MNAAIDTLGRDRPGSLLCDPEAAAAAVRPALLPDDEPSATFVNWDETPVPR